KLSVLLTLRFVRFCDSTDANDQITQNGYNQFNILCPRCSSIVLRKNTAKLANKQHNLPVFAKKSELSNPSKEFPTELTEEFWCVNDMYAFENVGFTNSVSTFRYLTCADCDLGPLGFHDTQEGPTNAYYIALTRTTTEGKSSCKK
ncbi:guanine nucleotide exchange factor, partial [Schistosoma bovis]